MEAMSSRPQSPEQGPQERKIPWLAVSDDTAARTSGGYWYHREWHRPAADVLDPAFQDQLMDKLAELKGIKLICSGLIGISGLLSLNPAS
ncbi:hypothetical protein ACU8MP_12815 [Rhizobium leguminosarum]